MVACRGCVGDRACGRGYGALGVHLRLPSRERGHQAPIRTAATADVNVARAALRESISAVIGVVRGRGVSVQTTSTVRPQLVMPPVSLKAPDQDRRWSSCGLLVIIGAIEFKELSYQQPVFSFW